MKKTALLLILAMCVALLPLGAAAAPVNQVSIGAAKDSLTISGEIPADSDKSITIEVLQPGREWADVEAFDAASGENILDYLFYFDILTVGSDRKYSVTVGGYTQTTEPEIRLRLAKNNYYYYSPKALQEINAAQTADALKTAAEDNAFLNEKFAPVLAALNENEQAALWKILLSSKNRNGGFQSLTELTDLFDEAAVLARLYAAADSDIIVEIVELCGDYGVKGSNSYDLFMRIGNFARGQLSDTQKSALCSYLYEKRTGYLSLEGFIEDFWNQTVLFACFGSNSKYYVHDVVTKADRLKELDLGIFGELGTTAQLSVCVAVNEGKRFETLSALANAIKNEPSGTEQGSSSNAGGGAGGRGGTNSGKSVGTIASNLSLPDDTNENTGNENTGDMFIDLEGSEWAREAIYALRGKGIISGRDAQHFDPSARVTREEFAKMLVLALGLYDENATADFIDANGGAWYDTYIASAKNAGIVSGIGENSFGVGRVITRQEMATLLARSAANGELPESTETGFDDDALISGWAKAAVSYARENGLMQGMGDNTFAPLAEVSRAQAAQAIYRLINGG